MQKKEIAENLTEQITAVADWDSMSRVITQTRG